MATDGCRRIGQGFGPITTSFAPGELSTIDVSKRATSMYDFSGLPCPPPSIDVPPGETYAPLMAPPSFIYALDPAFSTCVPGFDQGDLPPVDPPIAFTTVTGGLQGPGLPGDAPPRPRDLGARTLPLAGIPGPAKTAGPEHKSRV